ncbi:pirin family protein [Chondromyces apiculatus]|uniref:Pirin-related protein n=1 Tax=Chondromyces apiculatus DSM 436 TaxID=1192034 RepID=A0A017TF97_9BACT|nr:pirin family protein [Chondromyces apiculatus]EYF07291.1 Pirin-related protein [Chondromyces apiculatus DSM 436]
MLQQVINPRNADIGNGFAVRRILPFRARRMVGPFIFLDHGGPIDLPPDRLRALDVLPHPHIGLSTVSYLFRGKITHRDSTGVEKVIRPGDVNWMTAARGISHSERFEDPDPGDTGTFEMVQSWCAMPEADEENAPSFFNVQASDLPLVEERGLWMRLIAGHAFGLKSSVPVLSPTFYLHAEVQPGAKVPLPHEHSERAVYIVKGSVETGGHTYTEGQLLIFAPGIASRDTPALTATAPSTLMLLGGEPLGERFIWWNFVSSRKERLDQAKADWSQGRIPLPLHDDAEFIPLPEDRLPPR